MADETLTGQPTPPPEGPPPVGPAGVETPPEGPPEGTPIAPEEAGPGAGPPAGEQPQGLAPLAENVGGQLVTQNIAGDGRQNIATGKDVFDGTAIVATDFVRIRCGFRPKYVRWERNAASNQPLMIEYFDGMAANTCIKTASPGTRTQETVNGGITLREDGFEISQNVALSAIAVNSTSQWMAIG